jgi:hypothetical protein
MLTRTVAALIFTLLPLFGQIVLSPKTMKKIATVDPRFQSYNVEMVEVTGGRFWAPYRDAGKAEAKPATSSGTPGIDPSLFRNREPIDLANPRLRKLAAALGPAYMRVSGTWANSTYFHDSDEPAPAKPPAGFGGILTREQWRRVMDFSKAVDAKIVTSFAISPGVRDDSGNWTPQEAKKVLAFTKAAGGEIAAAELFNEPNIASIGGAPQGYTAAKFGKDFRVFRAFVKQAAPKMIVMGPGSMNDRTMVDSPFPLLRTTDLLPAVGSNQVDAFSYHFYGATSKRCSNMKSPQTTPEAALTTEWLAKTGAEADHYAGLRDRFEPGKPLWVSETGETACGGNPWAATFLDTFRYTDQLGRLAKRGVQVVMHNTLAASDYAIIDEETMTPRPSYWSALLWRRLMGTTVLEAGAPAMDNLYVYAHCLANKPGGVAILVINADRTASRELELPIAAERYTLSAQQLDSPAVELNGRELRVRDDGSLPELKGVPAAAGRLTFAPASITYLAIPSASNAACR